MIIEVALGIVLAVLILAFLPDLLGLGLVLLGLAALAIVGVMLFVWLSDKLVLVLLVAIGCALAALILTYDMRNLSQKTLRKRIQLRHELGYDTADLEKVPEEPLTPEEKVEAKRRRALGYTDKENGS